MRSRWWLLRHEFCIQDRNYDIGVHGMFILSRVCSFFFSFFFNHVGLFGGDISFFNHDMFMIWLIFHLLDSINVIKGFLEDKSKRSLEIVFFFQNLQIYGLLFTIYFLNAKMGSLTWDVEDHCVSRIWFFFYIYISPEDLSFSSFGIKKTNEELFTLEDISIIVYFCV
jgi:hypothetical protein